MYSHSHSSNNHPPSALPRAIRPAGMGTAPTTRANRRNPPPKRQHHHHRRRHHPSQQFPNHPRNGNHHPQRPAAAAARRRKKQKSPHGNNLCACYCGRNALIASSVLCLLLLYGISFSVYILFVYHPPGWISYRTKRFHHHHRPLSVSLGLTKEEERERLQKLQQEKLQQHHHNGEPEGMDPPEDDLEVIRREKNLQSILQKHSAHNETTKTFVRKYTRMIHFLHIHKSAGTFLCQQAFKNQMAADYNRNCNIRDDQKCCWFDDDDGGKNKNGNLNSSSNNGKFQSRNKEISAATLPPHPTDNQTKLLERTIRFAKTAPYDFVASEHELSEPMLPEYFDYVVTLRNSRKRYKSHWQHLLRNAERRKRDVQAYRDRLLNKTGEISSQKLLQKPKPHRGRGYGVSGQHRMQGNEEKEEASSPPIGSDEGEIMKIAKSWLHWMHGGSSSSNGRRTGIFGGGRAKARWVDTGEDPDQDPGHWNYTVVDVNDGSIHPVGNFTKWVAGQPDNYSLRMICGQACSQIPKYQITKDLFEHTLERLWVNFSHVLFVEDMEASYARFAKAYGWDPILQADAKSSSQIKANDRQSSYSRKDKDESLSDSPLAGDAFMTVLDDALYEFALRKYNAGLEYENSKNNSSDTNSNNATSLFSTKLVWKKDYAAFQNQNLVDDYFQYGPQRNCTNPCCGYCSLW